MKDKWDTVPVWVAAPFISGIISWFIAHSVYLAGGAFIGMALVATGRIVWLTSKAQKN